MGANHTAYPRRAQRATAALAALALTGLGVSVSAPGAASADSGEPTMMMPTGGGYEPVALQAFGKAAI